MANQTASYNSYQESEPVAASEADALLGPNADNDAKKDVGNYSLLHAFLIFFFPALGGLLFGYDIGATSAVVSQLTDSSYAGVEWYSVVEDSSFLQGVITSIGMFGAMLGSITCFKIADDLGRRRSLLVASVLFIVGSFIEYLSGDESWSAAAGITVLLIGRTTYGYACGFAMHGAPAYIGEMAPAAIRGVLVSLKEAFIVVGMVLGYSIGWYYSETSGGWVYTYGWASFMALIMLVGMYLLPYSARWLALKGRIDEAINSLRFVTPDLPESEIVAIRDVANKAASFQQNSTLAEDWQKLSKPTVFPALIAGVGLVVFQQITGQPSVLYYAVTILEDAGMSSSASIAVALFKLFMTLFATFTVDKHGRRLLLFIGCSSMLIALVVLGTAFLFDYTTADKVVILTALFIYIGGYQIGFGPISWLLISEIFPLEVRGKAVSIAVVMNFFWNTVMTLIFPEELEYIGAPATFYIYAVILVFGIYFIYHYVPETKGLTLEEIEENFLRGKKVVDSNDRNDTKPGSNILC